MNGRRFALIAAAALLVMFVSVNLIANIWLKSARLDLTEGRLYSLSEGADSVIRGVNEPIQLTFFYSRDSAARYPAIQAYAGRVRELLDAIAARSRGRIRILKVDPKPFSDEEDRAVAAGVEPTPLEQGADPIYFGLSGANSIDDTRAISFFNPQREPYLEYELTRLINELENPDPIHVALITSLPLDPAASTPLAPRRPNAFIDELNRSMQVETLASDFTAIPDDAAVLAIIHPAPLSPQQLYAIDQFVMRKGRAFIALDPASIAAAEAAGADPFAAQGAMTATASRLEPLLSHWGVAMSQDVVLDLGGALPVQAMDDQGQVRNDVPQPLFFNVPTDHLDRRDLTTAWLQRGLNFAAPGALSFSERQGVTYTPLAITSADTMRLPAERVLMRPSPMDVLRDWMSAQRAETIALRLSGPLQSAFGASPPEGATAIAGHPHMQRTQTPAELVVVGDTDFLVDDLYVAPNQTTFADNGVFAVNAISMLGGAPELIRLRSRAAANRPMTVVEDMEREATRRIEQQQTQLEEELQAAEQRLRQLQSQGRGSGFFNGDLGAELTPEERAELDRFRAHTVEVRGKLRAVQRNLRGGIDQLEAWVVFINVWLGPLIVACAGLFLFWRRQAKPAASGSAS